VLWLLLLLTPAWAHNGPPMALQPLVDGGELVAAGGSSGVVRLDGEPSWFCEDAFFLTPTWWHVADDRVLAGTTAALWESTDGGCNWAHRKHLPQRFWSSVVAEGDRLWMSTADRALSNAVWFSDDGGATTTRLPWQTDERLLELVRGEGLFVLTEDADGDWAVRRSDDDGQSWSEAHALTGWRSARLFAVSEDGQRLLMGATSESGAFWFLEQDAALAGPPTPVQDFYAPLTAAADLGGRTFVVTGLERLWADGPGGFEVLRDLGFSCLERIDGELWACGLEPQSAMVQRSPDGEQWFDALRFDDIQPIECPADSMYAQECPAAWERLQGFVQPPVTGDDDDDDDDVEPEPQGCGGPSAAWLLLAAGLGRPRRRPAG
jgi:hypothetical protein